VHDAPNFYALLESLRLEKTAAQEAQHIGALPDPEHVAVS
jgi:hypothetical protein